MVFEREGAPPELLQTKHHRQQAANLTDASPDLWKTLRVWCEGTTSGEILPFVCFYLITTSSVGEGSAASYLRSEGRDVEVASERLRSTAQSSTSQTNQPGYTAFLALSRAAQRDLFERVVILDASPNIVDLDSELQNEVRWAVKRQHVVPFLQRLEGWWLRRAVRQLASLNNEAVLSEEFEAHMDDLREQFKRDSLPIDDDILATEVDASVYQETVFVRQLQLIGIGAQRILAAIRE